jgi:hypothetical protein
VTREAPLPVPGCADAGAEVARLREVLGLVRELAGRPEAADEALDEAAQVSARYAQALPIDQKRFDGFANETARWAAAGVEALIRIDKAGFGTRPAAERLAEELQRALVRLSERLPG